MFCLACAAPLLPGTATCARCGLRALARPSSPASKQSLPWLARAINRFPIVAAAIALSVVVANVGLHQRADADAYSRGLAAAEAGDVLGARTLLAEAGDHADARDRLAQLNTLLDPFIARYESGARALEAGNYESAFEQLLPVAVELPGYRDVDELLFQARLGRNRKTLAAAQDALARDDWLLAERLITRLVAEDPQYPDVTAGLAEMKRSGAPYAYSLDGALYIRSFEAEDPVLVTNAVAVGRPVWSPDRTQIAFISPNDQRNGHDRSLYVINADGTGLRWLAGNPARWRTPAWSPDGKRIAFEVDAAIAGALSARIAVHIVDLQTGVITDVIGDAFPSAGAPAWSPRGERLAFVVRQPARLDSPAQVPAEIERSMINDIYVLHLATGAISKIGDGQLPDPWRIAWSPRNEQIVVFSRADGTPFQQGELYLLDAATGAFEVIEAESTFLSMPVWSPDGSKFAYVVENSVVRIVETDGSRIELLATSPLTGDLAWSLSGDRLLALGDPNRRATLLIEVGAEAKLLAELEVAYDGSGSDAGAPKWSPANPAPPSSHSVSGTAFDPGS